jgi:hypothetical protein
MRHAAYGGDGVARAKGTGEQSSEDQVSESGRLRLGTRVMGYM